MSNQIENSENAGCDFCGINDRIPGNTICNECNAQLTHLANMTDKECKEQLPPKEIPMTADFDLDNAFGYNSFGDEGI